MLASLASAVACVRIGQETRYVPYARDYRGYLVQRRYRGVGAPYYTAQFGGPVVGNGYIWKSYLSYQPYWQPFLNPLAVQQAGFTQAEVMRWVDEHPNAVFDHATFSAFCARWETNSHGLTVHALDLSHATHLNPPVYFTPHTCWNTGTTYFQLASNLPDADPVLLALLERAGLTIHQRENGTEGAWEGFYVTDYRAAESVLINLGFSFALNQRQVLYYAGVYTGIGEEEGLTYYATPQEAKAHVSLLPAACGQPNAERYPLATSGVVELLAGEQILVAMCEEKVLNPTQYERVSIYHRARVQEHIIQNAPIATGHLSPTETPLSAIVPTLGSMLAATDIPRREMAKRLGQSEQTLNQWEQEPAELTLREMQQVAKLLNIELPKLVVMLYDELVYRDDAFPKR